ncbi:hypothetical protein SNE40_019526 [Patella caerulea]|uniref:Uncharacterized protein n=1 Tax=Patella caerulea TaxID=87958 RepID=A0AAN8J8X0_PATCE
MESWQLTAWGLLIAFAFAAVAQQCTDDNKTYDDGEIYARDGNPCIKYVCNKGSVEISLLECNDGSEGCKPIGAKKTYFNGCLVMECVHSGNSIGFQFTKEACHDGTKCVDLNTESTTNCMTRRCEKNSDGAIQFTYTVLKCEDIDGNCLNPGDTFQYKFKDGTIGNSCTCTTDINASPVQVNYTCTS